ncbi:MAG TPA: hypothetical protein VOA87_15895, partial [Thermoanaerobaculia bacterium]|nr:hypothetical protein [Thermoanaerobaculia bacterium]
LLYLLSPDGVTPTDNTSDDNGGGGTNSKIAHVLTSTGTWTIAATTMTPSATGTYMLGLACAAVVCVPDAETLCLNNSRFKVQATFHTSQGQSGPAQAVGLTSDTGYFWFFDANNVEIVVKVLNGCGLGGHYWVFAGGLTNVNTVITVTDMQTGKFRTYTNSQGKAFAPIEDTGAFPTCP